MSCFLGVEMIRGKGTKSRFLKASTITFVGVLLLLLLAVLLLWHSYRALERNERNQNDSK